MGGQKSPDPDSQRGPWLDGVTHGSQWQCRWEQDAFLKTAGFRGLRVSEIFLIPFNCLPLLCHHQASWTLERKTSCCLANSLRACPSSLSEDISRIAFSLLSPFGRKKRCWSSGAGTLAPLVGPSSRSLHLEARAAHGSLPALHYPPQTQGSLLGTPRGAGGSHSVYTNPEGLVSNFWQSLGLIYISFGDTSPP